jgi:hypothetical protein
MEASTRSIKLLFLLHHIYDGFNKISEYPNVVKKLYLILFGYQDPKNFLISIHVKKYCSIIVHLS